MDKTRLWIIGCVLAMVAIGGLGWSLGVQPQLAAAAAADAQASQVAAANTASAAVLARLKKDSEDLPALTKKLAKLGASVPSEAQIPAFTTELDGFAAVSGVTISAWQISDGVAFAAPVPPAPAPASGASGSTASPAPSASPTPAPPTATAPGAPPAPSPLLADAHFTVVPVSFTVTGAYPSILAFIQSAQTGERLFLVNGLGIAPSATGGGFDGKVSGYVYVLSSGT